MKLLIITQAVDSSDPVLGFFHRWLIEFSKNFESVRVVCLRKGAYDLPRNIEVMSLGKEAGASRFQYLVSFYRYIFSARHKYDAVLVHMNPIYVILGAPFWMLMGKRISLWYVHKSVDWKLRISVFLVHRVFTASKESFRIATPKALVTGHGIDTEAFKPFAKPIRKERIIATIGRISRVKNIDFLLRVFARSRRGFGTPVKFEIIGNAVSDDDRLYADSLLALARELGIEQDVVFKGAISNDSIPQYLEKVDVTLNASATGSFDKAVLESMACGVPVLTTNEAFKDFLAPYGLYQDPDEERFAFVLSSMIRGVPIDALELRKRIEERHSLQNLVRRIAEDLSLGYST